MNRINKEKIIEILKKTNDFYKSVGEEFSNTRQYYWKGWEDIFPKTFKELKENSIKNNSIKILDIGCGNGRFYKYIKENIDKLELQNINIEYLGIDNNDTLLEIANNIGTKTHENKVGDNKIDFKKLDIFLELENIQDKFDLIVGFGITHHIPGNTYRKRWFDKLTQLLNKNGILILSYWNFLDKKSLIPTTDLEENDYWLGWNTTKEKRYCHYYDEKELNQIHKLLEEKNINIVEILDKKEDLNKYIVYRYN